MSREDDAAGAAADLQQWYLNRGRSAGGLSSASLAYSSDPAVNAQVRGQRPPPLCSEARVEGLTTRRREACSGPLVVERKRSPRP